MYTAQQEVQDIITSLHEKAGKPSTRALAKLTGLSHTTCAELLRGEFGQRPWVTMVTFIAALGGDLEPVHRLWVEMQVKVKPSTPTIIQLQDGDDITAVQQAITLLGKYPGILAPVPHGYLLIPPGVAVTIPPA